MGTNLLQSFKLLFYQLLKNINNFRIEGPWSATYTPYDPRELKSRKGNKENLRLMEKVFALPEYFQIFFIHVYERVAFFSMSRIRIRSYNEMERVLRDGQLKIKADSILTTTSNTTVAEI